MAGMELDMLLSSLELPERKEQGDHAGLLCELSQNQATPRTQHSRSSAWQNTSEDERPSMERLLRQSMVHLPQQGTKFLPVDKLYEIVCPSRVQEELRSRFHVPEPGLSKFVHEVCGSKPEDPHPRQPHDLRSRRRIFAILTLIGQVHQIQSVIYEGLLDSALPFTTVPPQIPLTTKHSNLPSVGKVWSRDGKEVRFMQDWTDLFREAFIAYQWTVLAPFFHFPGSSCGEAPHYDLPAKAVVPFISTCNTSQGGYSTVYKTVIHPAHYSIGGVSQLVSVSTYPKTRRGI
jgi:hypothetical protein